MNKLHFAIIKQMSGMQLREITKQVNAELKTHYLHSTISARIRDMPNLYTTVDQWFGRKRQVRYTANMGSILQVWMRVAA